MKKPYAYALIMGIAILAIFAGTGSARAEQNTTDIRDMMQTYESVLLGNSSYVQCNQEDAIYREALIPDEIYQWYGYDFEEPLKFIQFCVTDLDADGYPEIILQLSYDFGFELLRYENGVVYGFPFVSRAMEVVTQEGDIYGSSGAYDNSWYKIRFFTDRYEKTDTCAMQSTESGIKYLIGDTEVSESEYNSCYNQIINKKHLLWLVYTPDNFKAVVSYFWSVFR